MKHGTNVFKENPTPGEYTVVAYLDVNENGTRDSADAIPSSGPSSVTVHAGQLDPARVTLDSLVP